MAEHDSEHLVVTALGSDQAGIVNRLSMVILEHNCNICDSRMAVLGGEFAVILLVNGTADDIGRLQRGLEEQQDRLGLSVFCKRTRGPEINRLQRPCRVTAVSLDHPGIVQMLAAFFAERNINIENLSTGSQPAAHTGTPIFELQMGINVPAGMDIDPLREQFIAFCDERGIDARLEALGEQ
jgi:glycine cleavage system transcriptional repressor